MFGERGNPEPDVRHDSRLSLMPTGIKDIKVAERLSQESIMGRRDDAQVGGTPIIIVFCASVVCRSALYDGSSKRHPVYVNFIRWPE